MRASLLLCCGSLGMRGTVSPSHRRRKKSKRCSPLISALIRTAGLSDARTARARVREPAGAGSALTELLHAHMAEFGLQPDGRLFVGERNNGELHIGLAGIQDPEQGTVGVVLFLLFLGCMVAAVVSLVLRFRRSRGVERQQLKWFTYAGGLLILWALVTEFLLPDAASWIDIVFGLLMAFVPVAAGVAVLRYRLYDIDRLINRTVVYGLLTALLGL